MVKKVRRSNVKDGILLPLGNGFSLAIGKHPEKTDDIDIGPNNKNGLSINHGEILQQKGNTLRVFSAEPMLGGASPAQLLYGGMAADKVFAMQEQYKQANRIADDGTKYRKGGKKQTPLKEGIDWSDIKTTENRAYNSEYIDYINKSLTSRGFGKNQRAAILANIIEESGGNPFAVDGTGNFKGLLQWEKSRYWPGDETDVYKELDNQIQYIADTVGNSTDRKSWTHGGKGSGYNSLTDAMAAYNSEDDLEATMRGYTLGYVRPAGGINSYNNRLKVAKQIIDRKGFKDGGIYIKPSKRGTFTAAAKQHGMSVQEFASKVLTNKENYSSAMVKKANFARNASKWNHLYGGENILINSLGERPNAKYEKEMKNKRNKADRGGIQSIGSGGFINPFVDQYGNTIGINGDITQLAVPKGILVNPPKITPINDNINKGLTATGADAIGAGINTLGALVGAGIQQGAINKLKFTPRQYALLDPVKLKTKINIAPQIAKMREMQAQINDAARRTSASSRNTYQRIAAGNSRLLDSAMSLYGQKENMETELINQDLLNQQQVRQANVKNVIDTINYNNAGKTELQNRKRVLTSNNWTTALNTISGAWAGPNGFIDKQNARKVKTGELYVQAMANPDAARLLYGNINFVTDADKRKAFKTIYNFLNNNNLG